MWLERAANSVVASQKIPCDELSQGPFRSRRRAQLAARALTPDELEQPAAALPRLQRRLRTLAEARRFEDAARLRDRIAALQGVCRELDRLDRLRKLECCVLVPALDPGYVTAFSSQAARRSRTNTPARWRRNARDRGRSRGVSPAGTTL